MDRESLDLLRDLELRWRVPQCRDPYRQAIAELNASDEARDKRAAYNARFRAYGTITASDLAELREEQGDACYWCGTELNGGGHADHIVPVSRGGTSDRDNFCWACQPCNSRKRAKTPDEWEAERWLTMPGS